MTSNRLGYIGSGPGGIGVAECYLCESVTAWPTSEVAELKLKTHIEQHHRVTNLSGVVFTNGKMQSYKPQDEVGGNDA